MVDDLQPASHNCCATSVAVPARLGPKALTAAPLGWVERFAGCLQMPPACPGGCPKRLVMSPVHRQERQIRHPQLQPLALDLPSGGCAQEEITNKKEEQEEADPESTQIGF